MTQLRHHYNMPNTGETGAGGRLRIRRLTRRSNPPRPNSFHTPRALADRLTRLTSLSHNSFSPIYLVGHSWGTYLGMLVIGRHPELYHAYVGVGQLARSSPIAGIQDEYIPQRAGRMGDQDAIEELKEKGASVRETLLFKFGGEIHNAKSFMPLLLTGLAAPEYGLRDARDIPKGVSLYSRTFVYNSISGELMDVITQVEIPVYFFTGRFDYTDPFALTEQYFSKLNAPEKHIVWFEESAHFPFYEEPAAFARQMRGVLTATSPTK